MPDLACNLAGALLFLPFGLALGSFLELVSDRLPRGESILWPPSHCRICGHRLTAGELVPILSYLSQGGRCRACSGPIGRGVPVREALTALTLSLPWAVVGCGQPALALGIAGVALLSGWTARTLAVRRRLESQGRP